jgi:hypothetical protein
MENVQIKFVPLGITAKIKLPQEYFHWENKFLTVISEGIYGNLFYGTYFY